MSAERTVARVCRLAGDADLALRLTVRLTTPGEACVAIATSITFAHEPPLPDDIAVRLDDRLYDGVYDALAAVDGPLPPERLTVALTALAAAPPLAAVLGADDWPRVAAVGDCLADLAREATLAAWQGLVAEGTAAR